MADNPDLLVGQVVHLELLPAVQGLPVLDTSRTFSATSSRTGFLCCQLSFWRALVGSPAEDRLPSGGGIEDRLPQGRHRTRSRSHFVDAGRHSKAMSTSAKARSRNWRTFVISPVAKTWPSGLSCCSMRHMPSTYSRAWPQSQLLALFLASCRALWACAIEVGLFSHMAKLYHLDARSVARAIRHFSLGYRDVRMSPVFGASFDPADSRGLPAARSVMPLRHRLSALSCRRH